MSIKFNEVTWYSKLGAVVLFLLVVPALTFYIGMQYQATVSVLKETGNNTSNSEVSSKKSGKSIDNSIIDVMNGTYYLDNEAVTLVNGKSEESVAPGSALTIQTQIFGKPTYADLNGDNKSDAVFLIARQTGGTGTFFYVIASINNNGKYVPTNDVFIGDRISPQNINVSNGVIAVNYAERKPSDPMSEAPSIGVTKYLVVRGGQLVEK